jgi:glycosyltransferase involved in cell wall biosynthesis
MNWLIIEDALRDRHGHWLEFVQCFNKGLSELGDSVRVLGPKDASSDLCSVIDLEPVLPESLWRGRKKHGMGRGARSVSRLHWICASIWAIGKAVRSATSKPDVVFVPTVGIPHLFVWLVLLKTALRSFPGTVLLYFMSTPVQYCPDSRRNVYIGLGGRFFFLCLGLLSHESRTRRLVLATETQALSGALADLSGACFHTLPQPVLPFANIHEPRHQRASGAVLVGSYGPARYEKGSDLLLAAMNDVLAKREDVQFAIQWIEPFPDREGLLVQVPKELRDHPRVTIIDHLFGPGEYAEWLNRTDIMVLPYRHDYTLRGSRVVVEALVHGIPVIATAGSTMAEHSGIYGRPRTFTCESVASMVDAITSAVAGVSELQAEASNHVRRYQAFFSVSAFRSSILELSSKQAGGFQDA